MTTEINKIEVDPKRSLLPILVLGDRVVLKWIPPGEKFENTNIERPSTVEEQISKGVVMSIGPGLPDVPMVVEVGQTVNYFRQSRIPVHIQGQEYDMIRVSDIPIQL